AIQATECNSSATARRLPRVLTRGFGMKPGALSGWISVRGDLVWRSSINRATKHALQCGKAPKVIGRCFVVPVPQIHQVALSFDQTEEWSLARDVSSLCRFHVFL